MKDYRASPMIEHREFPLCNLNAITRFENRIIIDIDINDLDVRSNFEKIDSNKSSPLLLRSDGSKTICWVMEGEDR